VAKWDDLEPFCVNSLCKYYQLGENNQLPGGNKLPVTVTEALAIVPAEKPFSLGKNNKLN
jgi:hypothetical protein